MDNLEINLEYFENMLKCLPSNIFFKDKECRYVFCTHYWRNLNTNGEKDWSIKGKTDLEIRYDKENAQRAFEEDQRILNTGIGTKYRIKIDQDGITEYLEIIKNPYFIKGEIVGIVGLINDVTKSVIQEQTLEESAETDELTGLSNRKYLGRWLLEKNVESIYPLTVISADCNYLKNINDSHGHHIGDELLRMAASVLKNSLPQNSEIIRMGGDEFIIILPNTSIELANEYIKCLHHIEKDYILHGEQLSISYGVCEATKFSPNLSECFTMADKRMYEEKQKIHQIKKH